MEDATIKERTAAKGITQSGDAPLIDAPLIYVSSTGALPSVDTTGTDRDKAELSKGELTQRSILRAAIARFGQDGFRSTSVADIARDASVSGTGVYAYFPNKEGLFLAALDQDAAAVIREGVSHLLSGENPQTWRQTLILTLLEALPRHPLARRVLAGLEPDVTERVMELPALNELRKAVAEMLRADQLAGIVRPDIDPATIASGTITIIVTLLMGIIQFGSAGLPLYGPDVLAVFEAALDPIE
ncbi:MAG TPA: TetR/AcrR family transcriptional regulator [Microthrixaceae bacterium]|nr:TetR/AcrR family transcriptional regulator [Microthrixaceae bacterium]